MNSAFVVDASATLKLFIEEPGTEQARRFFGALTAPAPPVLYAPDLLYAECANTLWKCVSRYRYPLRHAQAALHALDALTLQAIPTQLLVQSAFRLSVRYRISVYDACYLALAERLRCPLVTEDLDLIRRTHAHASVPLRRLSDVA